MGYYIQGPNKGKAPYFIQAYGAVDYRPKKFDDIPEDKALVVVIDDGLCEVAGLAYDSREFNEFIQSDLSDLRQRQCLLMDKELAYQLAGFTR